MEKNDESRLASARRRLKTAILGEARSPNDHTVFHKLSLVAFFAWVGLGADGLSSTCYGPEEAFRVLHGHLYLGFFVAIATVITIFVISASYSQIIEQFSTGGGGYLVASKLLSPLAGTVSGCALLVDYVLTIALSISSGADAIFSFLPPAWYAYRFWLALAGVILLTTLNLRGVKESVLPLVPIFMVFVVTHILLIAYAIVGHLPQLDDVVRATAVDIQHTRSQIGLLGLLILLLRSYSMGAGTYTGIEAVSNALPILREPRVQTAKKTMRYMAISLSVTAMGIMFAYVLLNVTQHPGKTLNAVLLENAVAGWPAGVGHPFLLVTLISEAALLFIAAQSGFIGGPRVLANMAMDRWVPTHFAMLSDRLVTSRGILMMGGAALLTVVLTHGTVHFLIVLYSMNVFITFALSQMGMVRHWWNRRTTEPRWRGKLLVNGIGLLMTSFILVSVTLFKFQDGGWITLLVTGTLVAAVQGIRRYYNHTSRLLKRLDDLVPAALASSPVKVTKAPEYNRNAKTAVLLVNGFNGLGLHTLFTIVRLFTPCFQNFVFVQIGIVDAGNFKGVTEMGHLRSHIDDELAKYIRYMNSQGFYAECFSSVGIDVVDEINRLAPQIKERFPQSVFFGGQLAFVRESFWSRWLHNHIVFAVQRSLHYRGIPFVILPIRV